MIAPSMPGFHFEIVETPRRGVSTLVIRSTITRIPCIPLIDISYYGFKTSRDVRILPNQQ